VQVFTHMTHIGDVRSLVLHPGTTSHAQRTEEERELLGVRPGTLRLSIGIEDIEDLIADLDRVLQGVREAVA
jgi:O-acetylhomoserine (thiol)-lyase